MPTTLPTRAQIDRAGELTFDGVTRGDDPALAENASAKLARKRAEAARAAEATHSGRAPLATLPEPNGTAPAPDLPRIEIQTTVEHRGRSFTITASGLTLDQFCDLLDKRGYAPAQQAQLAAPHATSDDLPEGWKLCQKHHAPMRPRNKQNEHWHSHNVGTADKPLWCKGYKGSDSPGYEVD